MVFLHINKLNAIKDTEKNGKPAIILNNIIQKHDKNKVFVLIHMEGCGPCMATLPEWKKLEHVLDKFSNRNDIAIVDIERQALPHVKNIKNPPNSFPTIRYITNNGKFVETYEDSNIKNKDRTIDSFVEWINSKTKEEINDKKYTKNNKTKKNKTKKNKTKKYYGGRKWSLKYKHSINCKRPKGFSQKQYCKYGRKK
jgi:hypothetical protein